MILTSDHRQLNINFEPLACGVLCSDGIESGCSSSVLDLEAGFAVYASMCRAVHSEPNSGRGEWYNGQASTERFAVAH